MVDVNTGMRKGELVFRSECCMILNSHKASTRHTHHTHSHRDANSTSKSIL